MIFFYKREHAVGRPAKCEYLSLSNDEVKWIKRQRERRTNNEEKIRHSKRN